MKVLFAIAYTTYATVLFLKRFGYLVWPKLRCEHADAMLHIALIVAALGLAGANFTEAFLMPAPAPFPLRA